MGTVTAANSLSQARGLAAEGFIRWIIEYDIERGPSTAERYLADPDFLPPEPKWLRDRVGKQLAPRLADAWNREDLV